VRRRALRQYLLFVCPLSSPFPLGHTTTSTESHQCLPSTSLPEFRSDQLSHTYWTHIWVKLSSSFLLFLLVFFSSSLLFSSLFFFFSFLLLFSSSTSTSSVTSEILQVLQSLSTALTVDATVEHSCIHLVYRALRKKFDRRKRHLDERGCIRGLGPVGVHLSGHISG
jgi:hypothetical protein